MAIEREIQSLLAALAEGRAYPLVAPQETAKPYITYQVISNVPENSLDGDTGLSNRRFQIEAWADSYGGAKTLARSIRDAMVAAGYLRLNDVPDKYDSDTQTYGTGADYSVWGDS